jgi:hypothetical protein
VRTRHLDGIRVLAVGQQPLTLGLADPELLGKVGVGCRGRGRSI